MAHTMSLQILTPEKSFFDGEAEGLVVTIPDGEYAILPGHAPLVAPLMVGSLRICQNGKWREAYTAEGYVEVGRRHVFVFAQMCEWPEDIDMHSAKEAADRAEELLRQKQSVREYKSTKINLARAMAQLRIGSRWDPNL